MNCSTQYIENWILRMCDIDRYSCCEREKSCLKYSSHQPSTQNNISKLKRCLKKILKGWVSTVYMYDINSDKAVGVPFWIVHNTDRLKRRVWVRCFGWDILANTKPTMKACNTSTCSQRRKQTPLNICFLKAVSIFWHFHLLLVFYWFHSSKKRRTMNTLPPPIPYYFENRWNMNLVEEIWGFTKWSFNFKTGKRWIKYMPLSSKIFLWSS